MLALAPAAAGAVPGDARRPSADAPETLRLLRSDAEGIELTLDVTGTDLTPHDAGGRRWTRVTSPGMVSAAAPGLPALPTRELLLAVPPEGGLRIEVARENERGRWLEWPVEVAGDLDLAGSPALARTGYADADATASRAGAGQVEGQVSSDPAAELVEIGWLRDLRVARLALRPFAYDPDGGRLSWPSRLRVRIRFERPAPTLPAAPDGDALDGLLEPALLNAGSARGWRASPEPLAQQAPMPSAPAGLPLANLSVETEGLYRVSGFDLVLAGVALDGVDARRLQLLEDGRQVALRVTGEDDGRLDLTDSLSFFGQASTARDSRYRVYQLMEGAEPGRRMATRAVAPASGGRSPATTFAARLDLQQDAVYVSELPSFQPGLPVPPEHRRDRWYSKRVSNGNPFTQSLTGLAAAPGDWEARFQITVVGKSSFAAISPDHRLRLRVAGQMVGEATWDGNRSVETFAFAVPGALLQTEPVEVRIEAPGEVGLPFDQFYVDAYSVEYRRQLSAADGALRFRADAGARAFDLSGFGARELSLLDLVDPEAPVLLSGLVTSSGPAPYTARFDDAVAASYYVVEDRNQRAPALIDPRPAVGLAMPPAGADYLVIAHRDFLPALQPLLNARAGSHRVAVFDVQAVYDAFSHGAQSAQAIQDLIAWAYHR
ncbi:MAG: hypothetical protein KDH92_03535, partial [Chloroflexi bacterium]|nr:hypothetical protein [Chloroflexota bacterium]